MKTRDFSLEKVVSVLGTMALFAFVGFLIYKEVSRTPSASEIAAQREGVYTGTWTSVDEKSELWLDEEHKAYLTKGTTKSVGKWTPEKEDILVDVKGPAGMVQAKFHIKDGEKLKLLVPMDSATIDKSYFYGEQPEPDDRWR